MFWKKKKTQLEILIENDGFDHAANRLAEIINETIPSLHVARQFILEELDAARQGSEVAQHFVNNSGFKAEEYSGAMHNSFGEVDGENGPQQFLNALLISQLQHDINLMVSFRIAITDKIMQTWNLGKYQNHSASNLVDIFSFDNSDKIVSAPKGESKLIALLNRIEEILHTQMWHIQKVDYDSKHKDSVLFAIIGQSYLKFNGPDINIAKKIEASQCTLGLIENDLNVLPTVMLQLSFNFYINDIEINLHLFDSNENGGYNAIKSLASTINFSRDELLGSFIHLNPDSSLEKFLNEFPLYESELLYENIFKDGPLKLINHLDELMQEVVRIALRIIMSL